MMAAEAMASAGERIVDILAGALAIVDDFGLTTDAASYTERTYWRDYHRVRWVTGLPVRRGTSIQMHAPLGRTSSCHGPAARHKPS